MNQSLKNTLGSFTGFLAVHVPVLALAPAFDVDRTTVAVVTAGSFIALVILALFDNLSQLVKKNRAQHGGDTDKK